MKLSCDGLTQYREQYPDHVPARRSLFSRDERQTKFTFGRAFLHYQFTPWWGGDHFNEHPRLGPVITNAVLLIRWLIPEPTAGAELLTPRASTSPGAASSIICHR